MSQGGGPTPAPGAAKHAAGGGAGDGAPAPAPPKERDANMDATPDSADPSTPAWYQPDCRQTINRVLQNNENAHKFNTLGQENKAFRAQSQ